MAKLEIKHNPELTKEKLIELFCQHFNGKYEVYPTKVIDRDFVVMKSAISGVFVKLKQKNGRTEIVFNSDAPSALLRMFTGILIRFFADQAVMQDVRTFLESSPDFKKLPTQIYP